eukprot:411796_1
MTDGCISPGNRGFKEIREWIDDDGREVRSEVKDVGEILNRAEKLADKKGGKKGESKWKPENGNGDTVEPIKEESVAASPSGLSLDAALNQLESTERIAENKAVERLISSKRIVGNGWKKGFLNKPSRKSPQITSEKQAPLQEVNENISKNVHFKNGVIISDSELKKSHHDSDEPGMLGKSKKQQQFPTGGDDDDHPSENPPVRMSRFKAERMKNRK